VSLAGHQARPACTVLLVLVLVFRGAQIELVGQLYVEAYST
jgi:hypothetical protein